MLLTCFGDESIETVASKIVIFTDLDGCLLNKADYDFRPASPALERIRELGIPLVLASSKTEPEMRQLAGEMQLRDAPMICENGGVVFASRRKSTLDHTNKIVLGVERNYILHVLSELKSRFKFRSFEDLQIAGICEATDLPPERARTALSRACTEPLIWDDDESLLPKFEQAVTSHQLTFTRGGRFWHVAGPTTKGAGMQTVLKRFFPSAKTTIALGDSPIDQSMLDLADVPIGIPALDGSLQVSIAGERGMIAGQPGAAGWRDAVMQALDVILVD